MRALRASVVAAVLCAPFGACEASSSPLGAGNVLAGDVDATSQTPPPQTTDDGSVDSPFAPLDGPYGVVRDGYSPLAVCAQCACSPGTYCYAGSPSTSLSS